MKLFNKVPLVFECCKIVRGFRRSIICDLQRYTYRFMPNEIEDVLTSNLGISLEDIKLRYDNKYDDIIQENFDLLEKEELIFYTNNPEWFPAMSLEWDEPSVITNAIIDINPQKLFDFEKIWVQLSNLGCEHVQIRIYSKIQLSELETLIDLIGKKRIISLDVVLHYDHELTQQDLVNFVFRQPRVMSMIFHSSPEDRLIYKSDTGIGDIFFMKDLIDSKSHCGKITSDFFSIHINSFTESQHYNSCLNRKISIDQDGNIKNCPSMSKSFGNIKDTSLGEALGHPDFKKYWNITKDQISVCKDCEFRYICTDCRAYIENPEDMYSKPLKCGYNPYTSEWEDWSTNPLKQQAIGHYDIRDGLSKFKT